MPNEPENLNPPEPADSTFAETPEQKKINRIANEAAAKAGKRGKGLRPEPRYVPQERTFWNGLNPVLSFCLEKRAGFRCHVDNR